MLNRFPGGSALAAAAVLLGAAVALPAQTAAPKTGAPEPVPLGALAPSNISKSRPKPAFDITGTWLHSGGPNNGFRFSPPAGFKLTPAAQVHYDAAQKAAKEG